MERISDLLPTDSAKRIRQILPANGWRARYYYPDGEVKKEVAMWALFEDGTVHGLVGTSTEDYDNRGLAKANDIKAGDFVEYVSSSQHEME